MIFKGALVLLATVGLATAQKAPPVKTIPRGEPPANLKQIHIPPKTSLTLPTLNNRHLRASNRKKQPPNPERSNSERRLTNSNVVIEVLHDNYPWETSWELTNSQGQILASQAANSYFIQMGTVREELSLAPGTYNFNIDDDACDGLCCGYGYGGYSINVDGIDVASGSNFGCSDTQSFDVEESTPVVPVPVEPTPVEPVVDILTNNNVVIEVLHDNYPWETSWELTNSEGLILASQAANSYFIQMGTVREELSLAPGTYNFNIDDAACDGLCCGYGYGGYWIKVDGVDVASGTDFGCSDSQSFDIGGPAPVEPSPIDPVVDPLSNTYDVVIELHHDDYPWETSWELTNSADFVLASQASNSYFIQMGVLREELSLTDGTYNFNIGDDACDGLCCGYGFGVYYITVDGLLVASGSDFGCSDSQSFDVGDGTPDDPNVMVDILFDDYAMEVGWSITDSNGIVWAGHEAGCYTAAGMRTTEHLNLPPGMHTFTMTDTAGDGLCCGYGEGYILVEVNGVAAISDNGEFDSIMSQNFYVPS